METARHWQQHARLPVRFEEAWRHVEETVLVARHIVCCEIANVNEATLSRLVDIGDGTRIRCVYLKHSSDGAEVMLKQAAAELHCHGVRLNTNNLFERLQDNNDLATTATLTNEQHSLLSPSQTKRRRQRIALPPYPFKNAMFCHPSLMSESGGPMRKSKSTPQSFFHKKDQEAVNDASIPLLAKQLFDKFTAHGASAAASDFFDLGGDSMGAVMVIHRMKHTFGIDLDANALFCFPTLDSFSTHCQMLYSLKERAPQTPNTYVILRKATDTSSLSPPPPPLFVMAPSGGTLFVFRLLIQALPPNQTVVGLVYPTLEKESGKGDGDQDSNLTYCHHSVEKLAAYYVDAILAYMSSNSSSSSSSNSSNSSCQKVNLLGFSFSGLVAVEMAKLLTQAPLHFALPQLILVDAPLPDALSKLVKDTFSSGSLQDAQALVFVAMFGTKYGVTLQDTRGVDMDDNRQFDELCQRSGVLQEAQDTAHLRRYMNIFLDNIRAILQYTPQPQRDRIQHIMLIECEEVREMDPVATTTHWLNLFKAMDTGDDESRFHCHTTPGNHISMLFSPHVAHLARTISKHLTR
jgi:thioesterase domain-containing protein/acyl carrier protein